MHRKLLLKSLEQYQTSPWCDPHDLEALKFIEFVKENKDCFQREFSTAHLTASSWIWNEDESKALFTLHKKLGIWVQLGGHADGHPNLLEVAIKEAQEESGVLEVEPITQEIFDLSIHQIPKTPKEEAHLHYDVRYLLKIKKTSPLVMSSESLDLRWISPEDFTKYNFDASILKMQKKLQNKNCFKLY